MDDFRLLREEADRLRNDLRRLESLEATPSALLSSHYISSSPPQSSLTSRNQRSPPVTSYSTHSLSQPIDLHFGEQYATDDDYAIASRRVQQLKAAGKVGLDLDAMVDSYSVSAATRVSPATVLVPPAESVHIRPLVSTRVIENQTYSSALSSSVLSSSDLLYYPPANSSPPQRLGSQRSSPVRTQKLVSFEDSRYSLPLDSSFAKAYSPELHVHGSTLVTSSDPLERLRQEKLQLLADIDNLARKEDFVRHHAGILSQSLQYESRLGSMRESVWNDSSLVLADDRQFREKLSQELSEFDAQENELWRRYRSDVHAAHSTSDSERLVLELEEQKLLERASLIKVRESMLDEKHKKILRERDDLFERILRPYQSLAAEGSRSQAATPAQQSRQSSESQQQQQPQPQQGQQQGQQGQQQRQQQGQQQGQQQQPQNNSSSSQAAPQGQSTASQDSQPQSPPVAEQQQQPQTPSDTVSPAAAPFIIDDRDRDWMAALLNGVPCYHANKNKLSKRWLVIDAEKERCFELLKDDPSKKGAKRDKIKRSLKFSFVSVASAGYGIGSRRGIQSAQFQVQVDKKTGKLKKAVNDSKEDCTAFAMSLIIMDNKGSVSNVIDLVPFSEAWAMAITRVVEIALYLAAGTGATAGTSGGLLMEEDDSVSVAGSES